MSMRKNCKIDANKNLSSKQYIAAGGPTTAEYDLVPAVLLSDLC